MTAHAWLSGVVAVFGVVALTGATTSERAGLPEGQSPVGAGVEGLVARGKVDINTAPAADLERLPGMNQKLSQRIIANRPYRKIDDLVRRKVLGRKQLAAIKEYITVAAGGGVAEGLPSP